MEQHVMTRQDKGINQDKSAFIPFSTSRSRKGDKGINLSRVYPVSPLRIAGVAGKSGKVSFGEVTA